LDEASKHKTTWLYNADIIPGRHHDEKGGRTIGRIGFQSHLLLCDVFSTGKEITRFE
jgi:hypothetical protein